MRIRGMWRWIGLGLNVLCIALVASLMALYVRQISYWDYVEYDTGTNWISLSSHVGRLDLHVTDASVGQVAFTWDTFIDDMSMPLSLWIDWSSGPGEIWIAIPLWFLILLFAIKPTWSFMTWMRRRRRLRNDDDHPICANCGYDLHGITSGKCPECGALF